MNNSHMFLGRAKTDAIPDPDNPGETITGPDRVFLEGDADLVVRSLHGGIDTEYFFIKLTPGNVALQPVKLKSGPRTPGRELDIAEIVANGVVVGDAEVER